MIDAVDNLKNRKIVTQVLQRVKESWQNDLKSWKSLLQELPCGDYASSSRPAVTSHATWNGASLYLSPNIRWPAWGLMPAHSALPCPTSTLAFAFPAYHPLAIVAPQTPSESNFGVTKFKWLWFPLFKLSGISDGADLNCVFDMEDMIVSKWSNPRV